MRQLSCVRGVYTPEIFDGCMSVKYLTHARASVVWEAYTPKYLTDASPSNIWGVYTPQIFDGCLSVKYLTHAALVVCGVYTPKMFDGCMSVKYLGGVDALNI